METELTKQIKQATHSYRPKMPSSMRTIRYADEVTLPGGGIVDSIRFEDYEESKTYNCFRIEHEQWEQHIPYLRNVPEEERGKCKYGEYAPNAELCKGCVFHFTRANIGIMSTAFEVKITYSDFMSKHGHNIDDLDNPIANENYYCLPKELIPKVEDMIPKHCGILSWNGNGLRKYRDAQWIDIDDKTVITLLYNALRKWVDSYKPYLQEVKNDTHW